jgi:hypothetical protein
LAWPGFHSGALVERRPKELLSSSMMMMAADE